MSLQGAEYHVKVHTDATNRLVLDGIEINGFTYDAENMPASVTTVYVNDYPGAHVDSYVVQFAYIFADIPVSSTTLAKILSDAQAAIAAVVPGAGGGSPSVDPSI